MTEKTLEIKYREYASAEELEAADRELLDAAKAALAGSYAPYSNFNVGAAVRLGNDLIIKGANQENSAYPSGLCAERTAIFFANSQYPECKVSALAISAFFQGQIVSSPITPCGSCRQVLLETENRQKSPIKLILAGKDKCYIISSIKDILPLNFDNSFFE